MLAEFTVDELARMLTFARGYGDSTSHEQAARMVLLIRQNVTFHFDWGYAIVLEKESWQRS